MHQLQRDSKPVTGRPPIFSEDIQHSPTTIVSSMPSSTIEHLQRAEFLRKPRLNFPPFAHRPHPFVDDFR